MTTAPDRRWFQFRLRTLFVLVTTSGLLAWWVRSNIEQLGERDRLLQWADSNGVQYGGLPPNQIRQSHPLPIAWQWLGAKRIDILTLDKPTSIANHKRLKSAFPETLIVDYTQMFPDPPYSRPAGVLPEISD